MKYYCEDCKKEVSGKNRRCRSCSKKGKRNSGFGGHKKDCLCPFCKAKRGEQKGVTSPNYKEGIYSDNKPKCIIKNCNNIVVHKNTMCQSHANQLKNFGSKSHFWRGGISVLSQLIRHLFGYDNWIEQCFIRDNYRCQECYKIGGKLEVHHIKPFALILQEFLKEYSQFSPIDDKETLARLAINYKPFWDLSNGKTLCKKCHYKLKKETREKIGGIENV